MRVFVGCSKRTEWWAILSKLIIWLDKFPASHFYIRFQQDNRSVVKESGWPKSRSVDYQEWLKAHVVVKEWELPYNPIGQRAFFEENMKKKYSFAQLFAILVQFIWPGFRPTVNDSRYLICTELVARWLNTFYGVEFTESFDTISMRELSSAIEKLHKEIKNGVK